MLTEKLCSQTLFASLLVTAPSPLTWRFATVPHFPKPFYRKPRRRWYVQINGKQINLGPDRDEAFRLYHEMMADPTQFKGHSHVELPTAGSVDLATSSSRVSMP